MKTLINALAVLLLASILFLSAVGVNIETHHYDFGSCKHLMIGGHSAHTWYE